MKSMFCTGDLQFPFAYHPFPFPPVIASMSPTITDEAYVCDLFKIILHELTHSKQLGKPNDDWSTIFAKESRYREGHASKQQHSHPTIRNVPREQTAA
jgi:hypothetical protein